MTTKTRKPAEEKPKPKVMVCASGGTLAEAEEFANLYLKDMDVMIVTSLADAFREKHGMICYKKKPFGEYRAFLVNFSLREEMSRTRRRKMLM